MGPIFTLFPSHAEAQQKLGPLIKHSRFLGVTWGLVEAGGSVGGCSFITVVTMEEPEPKTAAMGEGASLGGVRMREGEAAEEEEGGSSRRSLSLNAELNSGSGRNPGQTAR